MRTLKDYLAPPPLTHLKRLTTKDGLIQHADHEVPDPSHGYSIDDNARALIACLWHYSLYQDKSVLNLAEIYFNYLRRAEREEGSFHNFLSFTEKVLDSEGSEDSIGRAVWALGETVRIHPDSEIKKSAQAMIARSKLERHFEHSHVRAKAYILLGKIKQDEDGSAQNWANNLVDRYKAVRTDDWCWFEDSVRYANGILPYALSESFIKTRVRDYLNIAVESFDWLDRISRINGLPAPIGQDGWYFQNKVKADYDQQPLEAADMVLAALSLYRSTEKKHYLEKALEWMDWYYGNNVNHASLYNETTKGVQDALTRDGVNNNQGAESIVTFLLAYLKLGLIANEEK